MQGMDQTLMSLGMWSYDCQNVTELTKWPRRPMFFRPISSISLLLLLDSMCTLPMVLISKSIMKFDYAG
jgi:hypothetical protein